MTSGFAASAFLTGLGVSAGVSAALFGTFWLAALRLGRVNVVDSAWGLGFVAVAAATFGWSSGALSRRVLVLVLVGLWGLRLAFYIARRSRGAGEDPRYLALLARGRSSRAVSALLLVFGPQAALVWFISLPVQAAMAERGSAGPWAAVGAALWAVGVAFEAVGDAQLAAFKADPQNRGAVMDRGLWRYTRHPNYFGEACLWSGLYVVAAGGSWAGAATLPALLVMVYLVAFGSGKPLLERAMLERPGYREYAERTSGFFPLPPRKG